MSVDVKIAQMMAAIGDNPIKLDAETIAAIVYGFHAKPEEFISAINTLTAKKPVVSSKNDVIDGDNKTLHANNTLIECIEESSLMYRFCQHVAKTLELPVDTVFLCGLGVFSAIACRKYFVTLPRGKKVPLGLYVVGEQPSGVGKTSCLSFFQTPFFRIHDNLVDDKSRKIARLSNAVAEKTATQDEEEELAALQSDKTAVLFTTNATTAGLELVLPRNTGFFSAISSEQGLFNTLFPHGASYASDNDILLNGFDAGHIAVGRVTREGFTGNCVGAIVCLAQPGSIDSILAAGESGTGLSERYLLIAEPHRLGKRNREAMFMGEISQDFDVVAEYDRLCDMFEEVIEEPRRFNDLYGLQCTEYGYRQIGKYLNTLEPKLIDGGELSHATLRGAVGKIDIQILKIAANLHLLDTAHGTPAQTIADKHVISAIAIADTLLSTQANILRAKGMIGQKAEYEAILEVFSKKNHASEREIIMAKRAVKPFKLFTGNVSDLIRKTLSEMVENGLLRMVIEDGKHVYSLAQ